MNKMSPRLSGFELLRIMAIWGIILHHLFINDIVGGGKLFYPYLWLFWD